MSFAYVMNKMSVGNMGDARASELAMTLYKIIY